MYVRYTAGDNGGEGGEAWRKEGKVHLKERRTTTPATIQLPSSQWGSVLHSL